MRPEHLWTIRWTQPYATNWQRPYLRAQQENMEKLIEVILENEDYAQANEVINRIKAL